MGCEQRGRVSWLTCAVDRVDHAVSDEAFAGARGDGSYVAMCDARVWASSLAAPPAGRCPACAARATPAARAPERPSGLWQRLVQRPSS